MAFTEQKNEMIRKDLLDEALRCAVTIGVRKTSVEQLTHSCRLQIPFRYQSYDLHRKQCGVFVAADKMCIRDRRSACRIYRKTVGRNCTGSKRNRRAFEGDATGNGYCICEGKKCI